MAVAAWSCARAHANEPAPTAGDTTITLTNGEVIKGKVKSAEKDAVVVSHPLLGDVRVPRSAVTKAEPALPEPPPPPPPPPPPKAEEKKPEKPEKPSLWAGLVRKDEKPFLEGWGHNLEFGLNGSSGNSDYVNLRAAFGLRRQTKKMTTAIDLCYVYGRDNRGESRNRYDARARQDWNLGDTNWTLWIAGAGEVDGATDWQGRISGSSGMSYTFVKDESTTLLGRLGLGASRQVDGPDNTIHPEAVASFDLSHKIDDRNSLYANGEFYPDLAETENYRFVTRAGWVFNVNPAKKITLRTGIEDRYNSNPGRREPNDFDFFAVLAMSF